MKNSSNIKKFLFDAGSILKYFILRASLLCLLSSFLFLPSCSLKWNMASNINMDYPLPLKDEPFNYFGFELETPKFLWDQIDLATAYGSHGGEEQGELETTQGIMPKVGSATTEWRLCARWFPFEKKTDKIKPYLGLGVGYFNFHLDINSKGDFLYSEYLGPFQRIDVYEVDQDQKSLAYGWFPFFSSGLYLPIGKPFSLDKESSNENMRYALHFEYLNDFSKEDNGFDLNNSLFLIGISIIWK
jgi:hypothetical protein